MDEHNGGSKFIYFIAGIGIGALVGILFAPKSGRETREYLGTRADEGRDYLRKRGRELREQATDYMDRGKGVLTEQRDHLSAAIEAGKQAYRSESQSKSSGD
jgi:gas vesicle protein